MPSILRAFFLIVDRIIYLFRIHLHKQTIEMLMNKSNIVIPVFPLPVFLLPGGITRLRVFEPRYLTLVKIAIKECGFLIKLNHQEACLSQCQWGSWVEIINFDQADDQVLEIDVKCKSLVEVMSFNTTKDNLSFASVAQLPHWSQNSTNTDTAHLVQPLNAAFKENTILSELYSEQLTDNENWVIARWLELLPVSLAVKNSFVSQHDFETAKSFVESILVKSVKQSQ